MENIIFRVVGDDKDKITSALGESMTLQRLYETFTYKIIQLMNKEGFDISKLVFGDYNLRVSQPKKEKNYPKEVEDLYRFFVWANQSDEDVNHKPVKYGEYRSRDELPWSNFVSAKPSKSWYHWIEKLIKKENFRGGINRLKMVILFCADETNNYMETRNKDGQFYYRIESPKSLYDKYEKVLDKMESNNLMDDYKKQLIDLINGGKNDGGS